VSAAFAAHDPAPWLARPSVAALASLLAVSAFTVLVGLGFLPAEMQQALPFASVTHAVELSDGSVVSLFWATPSGLAGARKHYLALHSKYCAPSGAENGVSKGAAFPWPDLHPLSLARGPGPDQLLVGTWDGAAYMLDAHRLTSERLNIDLHRGGVIALACSPDGQCVVTQGSGELRAWDLNKNSERWRRTDVFPFCFVLAPDSKTAVIANPDGEVLQIDLDTGRTLQTLARLPSIIVQLAISPEGGKLAILSASGRLLVLEMATQLKLWEQPFHVPAYRAPARVALFSPSGETLVTTNHEKGSALVVWDAQTGRPLREMRGHRRIVQGVEFTAGGDLRSWGADGTIRLWDLPTGELLRAAAVQPPLNAT